MFNLLKFYILFFLAMTLNIAKSEELNKGVNITLQSAKITLDPGGIRDTQSLFVSRQINCELIKSEGSTFSLDAAESIKYLSPLKIVIKLKKTAAFHDNSAVKTEDVIASLDYIQKSKTVFNSFFSQIQEIKKIDDQTILFVLKKESPQFLKILSAFSYPIFKKDFIEKAIKEPRLWDYPLGCGGYKIAKFDEQVILLSPLKKNSLPISFHLIEKNQIDANEINNFDIVTVGVNDEKSVNRSRFNIIEIFNPKQFFIGLNSKSSKWQNKSERCAFLSQLNFDVLVNKHGDEIIEARDLIPKGTLGYQENGKYIEKLRENIKKLYRKKDDSPFCIAYLNLSVQEKYKDHYLQLIKEFYPNAYLKPIMNVKHFGKQFRDENCDAIFFGLATSYYDGYEFLTVFENNDGNFSGINDANLFNKLLKSQELSTATETANAYREIIDTIASYCVVRPIYTTPSKKIFVNKKLKTPGIGLAPVHQYYLGNISWL